MNPNTLTTKTQAVIQEAQMLAQQASHAQIENDHLLKVLADVDSLQYIFKKLGVNLPLLKQTVEKNLASKPSVQGGQLSLSPQTNSVFADAWSEAQKMKDEFVAVEHLLLALVKNKSTASQILKDQGVNEKELISAIEEMRQGARVTSASAEESYQALEKYARNLNQMAQDGSWTL